MNCFKKISFHGVFLFSLCIANAHSSFATTFILGRIHFPEKSKVEAAILSASKRKNKKYMMTSAAAATTLAAVYGLACIRKAALKRQDLGQSVVIPENTIKEKNLDKANKNTWFLDLIPSLSLTDFAWDFSKFFADAGTVFTAGVIISFLHDFVRTRLVDMYQDETLSWFISHQTKLKNILADIKDRVVGYDLHSELLSFDVYPLKKEVYLEAFVSDICQSLVEFKGNGNLKELSYYQTLVKKLEKKYKEEARSVDGLQSYVMPILSKKKRNIFDSNKTDLFNRDTQLRMDIAFLCDLFVEEFTSMLAFVQAHKHDQQLRIVDLIDTSNQFLDQIEFLLNTPKNELDELSKENRGFFTVVYEYEMLFDQQVAFLDQYCNSSVL